MGTHSSPGLGAAGLAVLMLLVVACGPSASAPTNGQEGAPPSVDVIEPAAASVTTACGDGDAATFEHPDWPLGGLDGPGVIPLLVSSLVSVGPNRLLYNVTDADHRVLAAPDVRTSISLYALGRDATTPAVTLEGTYLETPLQRGMYRANVDLDCAGEWGMEVSVRLADGSTASERMRFRVDASGTTPPVGRPAPRSDSPTASTLEELARISTDPDPHPGAYARTVGEVVTSGQPSLVLFATPSFCQTGYCGPTVNLVKSVALDYADRVGYVNVEPYELRMTENGLQPRLDADGNLIPVQAVLDYGVPVEPYLFVVDAQGDVFAKFEGVVGDDELRAAIEDVLAQMPTSAGSATPAGG